MNAPSKTIKQNFLIQLNICNAISIERITSNKYNMKLLTSINESNEGNITKEERFQKEFKIRLELTLKESIIFRANK